MAVSLAALSPFILSQSFATTPDIGASASTANCDSGVLHSTTGPTAFQAEWSANTINLKFFNDDTQFSTGSCIYDGAISLPSTNPSKQGYTFAGWQVRQQSCFAGIDTSIDGTSYYTHGWMPELNYAGERCYNSDGTEVNCSDSAVSDLGRNEWKVNFSYGTVYGESACTQVNPITNLVESVFADETREHNPQTYSIIDAMEAGTLTTEEALDALVAPNGPYENKEPYAIRLVIETGRKDQPEAIGYFLGDSVDVLFVRPSDTFNHLVNVLDVDNTNQYCECWCRVTSFVPTNGNSCDIASSQWVYVDGHSMMSDGYDGCANECAYKISESSTYSIIYSSVYRRLLYGISQ